MVIVLAMGVVMILMGTVDLVEDESQDIVQKDPTWYKKKWALWSHVRCFMTKETGR